jgi:hypothetical protein
VEVRRVSAERVGSGAPNKGLCAGEKTTFVALGATRNRESDAKLALAAFNGSVPPGPSGDAASLCGAFTYAPLATEPRG